MPVPNICYLDSETRDLFDDVGGRGEDVGHWLSDDFKFSSSGIFNLSFGMAATYDNAGLRFWLDPLELIQFLVDDSIDMIVTFNGDSFDFPMILSQVEKPEKVSGAWQFSEGFQTFYTMLGKKSVDVLVECEKVLGHRVKLDQLIQAMFGKRKEMDGADWWKFYTSGDLEKNTKAVNYLIADVLDLYKIYAVAHEMGKLAYMDNVGQARPFDIKIPTLEDIKAAAGAPY